MFSATVYHMVSSGSAICKVWLKNTVEGSIRSLLRVNNPTIIWRELGQSQKLEPE